MNKITHSLQNLITGKVYFLFLRAQKFFCDKIGKFTASVPLQIVVPQKTEVNLSFR